MVIGVALLVGIWAFLIAWIARVATSRGRNLAVWAIAGGAVGIVGFTASLGIMERAVDSSPFSDNWWLLSGLAPLVCMALPMAGLAYALGRMPVHVGRHKVWRVHAPGKGEGRLSIAGGELVLEWRELQQRVALDQLRELRIDGECLRLAWTSDGSEIAQVLMPMEKPQTRAGRQAQCAALAQQLKRR